MMGAFLYYGLFAAVCIVTAGVIGRWIAPIRWGVLGIALVLAPAFPPRGGNEGGVSWVMTVFAVGGLLLLAADIRGRLRARRGEAG
jgi:hypothetical protein